MMYTKEPRTLLELGRQLIDEDPNMSIADLKVAVWNEVTTVMEKEAVHFFIEAHYDELWEEPRPEEKRLHFHS
jgi:hypothetical protein